ncbi:hypothetical protein HanHA89_Chr07g0266051 [Helianthus annuus]|nr:hypothetical protein HanHA89_Chr07g0266051 [Helianthus annuus]
MKKLWLVGSDKLYIGSRDETMRVWVANLDSMQGLLKWVVKWAACSVKAHVCLWVCQTLSK